MVVVVEEEGASEGETTAETGKDHRERISSMTGESVVSLRQAHRDVGDEGSVVSMTVVQGVCEMAIHPIGSLLGRI